MALILSGVLKETGESRIARFDIITNETIEQAMEISKHPVEDGPDVSDHAKPENKVIKIEGYVSNKPLYSNPGVEKLMAYTSHTLNVPHRSRGARPHRVKLNLPHVPLKPNAGALIGAGLSALKDAITGGTFAELAAEEQEDTGTLRMTSLRSTLTFPDRARLMYEALDQAQQTKALITVSTRMVELDNMMIEHLSVPRQVDDGSGASFSLDLTRVRIVKSTLVSAPIAAEARGTKLTAAGSKTAKEDKNDEAKKTEEFSLLLQGYGGIQGIAKMIKGGGATQ